jgi:hypothetical protein
MAVCSNSLIDDSIIRYLALRSILLHNYFLSFDTYKFLTFCFVIVVACFQAAADLTQKQNIDCCCC